MTSTSQDGEMPIGDGMQELHTSHTGAANAQFLLEKMDQIFDKVGSEVKNMQEQLSARLDCLDQRMTQIEMKDCHSVVSQGHDDRMQDFAHVQIDSSNPFAQQGPPPAMTSNANHFQQDASQSDTRHGGVDSSVSHTQTQSEPLRRSRSRDRHRWSDPRPRSRYDKSPSRPVRQFYSEPVEDRGYQGEMHRAHESRYTQHGYSHNRDANRHDRNGSFRTKEDFNVRVKNFVSKDTDWLDYRTYFLKVAGKAAWSEDTKCVKLLGALESSLLGSTSDLPDDFTFAQLLDKLDHVNGSEFARKEAENQLMSIKRREGETVVKYAERVRQTVNRAFPYYIDKAKDEQALKAFLQGLSTKHDFRLKMKSMQFKTLHEAVSFGSNLDHVLKEESSARHNYTSRAVDIDTESESDADESEVEMFRKTFEKFGKKFDKFEKRYGSRFDKRPCKFQTNQDGNGENDSKDSSKTNDAKYIQNCKCPNCGHEMVKTRELKTRQNSPCHLCSEIGHWASECPLKESLATPHKGESQTLN